MFYLAHSNILQFIDVIKYAQKETYTLNNVVYLYN